MTCFDIGFSMWNAFATPDAKAAISRSRVGPSLTVSDARAALDIDESAEVTVDVVEAAFENNAAIMVAEGERDVGATGMAIMALKNFRQARSRLLRNK
jgi:hypothetical protein